MFHGKHAARRGAGGNPAEWRFGGPIKGDLGVLHAAAQRLEAGSAFTAPRLPERWQSGRSRRTRNAKYGNSVPGVRIPPSPPIFWLTR